MFYAKSMQSESSCSKSAFKTTLVWEFHSSGRNLFIFLEIVMFHKSLGWSVGHSFKMACLPLPNISNICLLQAVGQSSDGRSMYKQQGGDNFLFFLVKVTFPFYNISKQTKNKQTTNCVFLDIYQSNSPSTHISIFQYINIYIWFYHYFDLYCYLSFNLSTIQAEAGVWMMG